MISLRHLLLSPLLCLLAAFAPLAAREDSAPLDGQGVQQHRIDRPSIESLVEELSGEHPAQMQPTVRERLIARAVTSDLVKSHYVHPRFTPETNERWYRAYFAALDPARIYFRQSDLDEFRGYIPGLCSGVSGGKVDLRFPLAVYQRLLERMIQCIRFSIVQLDQLQDFTVKETMPIYRRNEDIPWCRTEQELQERWRLRVKNVLLSDMLREEEKRQKADGVSADPAPPSFKREDVRTRNKRQLISSYKMRRDAGINQVLEIFLSTAGELFDPHSCYMAPASQEDFNMRMSLSLQGIGATLSIRDSYVTVIELMPGSPAKRSGKLHPGDRIVAVAQSSREEPLDVTDMALDKVVQKIRGPKGSEVFLTIMPAGSESEHVVRLVRDEIKMKDAEAQGTVLTARLPSGRQAGILQIYLPSFYQDFGRRSSGRSFVSATRDVRALIRSARQSGAVDGLILDLRGNGGGSLDEAVTLAGLFMGNGPVVQIRDAQDGIQLLKSDAGDAVYKGPMIVLTDRYSASASEIVAAALQDRGRAIVVGDASTHGKGSVQTVIPLERNGAIRQNRSIIGSESPGTLKMTIAKFYRINGSSTQERGVVPDIVFPSFAQYMDTTESTFPNVLPWDQIAPVRYAMFNLSEVSQKLPSLRQFAQQYMERNPAFAAYAKAVEDFRRQREIRQIPMDLDCRRQYRKDENALLKKVQHYQPVRKSDVDEKDRYRDEDDPEWLEDVSKHEDVILDATVALMVKMLE